MIRKKQFSKDLPQGEMELPTVYVFRSTNLVMHSQLRGHVSDTMKTYNDAKSKTLFLKEESSLKDKKVSNFMQNN